MGLPLRRRVRRKEAENAISKYTLDSPLFVLFLGIRPVVHSGSISSQQFSVLSLQSLTLLSMPTTIHDGYFFFSTGWHFTRPFIITAAAVACDRWGSEILYRVSRGPSSVWTSRRRSNPFVIMAHRRLSSHNYRVISIFCVASFKRGWLREMDGNDNNYYQRRGSFFWVCPEKCAFLFIWIIPGVWDIN